MSRCFPYPPPGYTLSRSSNEALIESIKPHKKEKSKEQRKEKGRDRKEKKNGKHKNSKEKKDKTTKTKVDTQIAKNVLEDTKIGFISKIREIEIKQLDRSNLTSEHEQPMCLDGPCTSFDSTETSNKRKRDSSPVVDCSRNRGNVIRIRLTSTKQNESSPSAVLQHCSLPDRSDYHATKKESHIGQTVSCKTDSHQICAPLQPVVTKASCNIGKQNESTRPPLVVQNTGKQNESTRPSHCSTSGRSDFTVQKQHSSIGQTVAPKTEIIQICAPLQPVATRVKKLTSMHRAELKYNNLIVDWTPPRLQLHDMNADQDLDWLLQSKKPVFCTKEERRKCGIENTCSSSSVSWPRAQFLDEVDMYALPYTVPF